MRVVGLLGLALWRTARRRGQPRLGPVRRKRPCRSAQLHDNSLLRYENRETGGTRPPGGQCLGPADRGPSTRRTTVIDSVPIPVRKIRQVLVHQPEPSRIRAFQQPVPVPLLKPQRATPSTHGEHVYWQRHRKTSAPAPHGVTLTSGLPVLGVLGVLGRSRGISLAFGRPDRLRFRGRSVYLIEVYWTPRFPAHRAQNRNAGDQRPASREYGARTNP